MNMSKTFKVLLIAIVGTFFIIADETTDDFIFIADSPDVMQFETDNRVGEFEPHFHYDIKPVPAIGRPL